MAKKEMTTDDNIHKVLVSLEQYIEMEPLVRSIISTHMNYIYSIAYEEGIKKAFHRKPVYKLRNNKVIGEYKSAADAAKRMGVSVRSMYKHLSGGSRTCKGYTWEYVKKEKAEAT